MMTVAAISGPHRVGLLAYTGNGVEAENILNGTRLTQMIIVSSSVQERGLRERFNLIRLAGLSDSCVQSARQRFRVTAFSEDGLAIDTAFEAGNDPSSPTIKVKFQLQRECQFGQQFKVVGGGSQFGDWDPRSALPLYWSEGHLWTTEVDIPKGRKFEWKYILVSSEGEEIEWQSGPNHLLETVPGVSSLLVSIPWETISQSADFTSGIFQEVQRCQYLGGQDSALDTNDLDSICTDSKVHNAVEKLTEAAASAAADVLKAGVKAATIAAASLDALPAEELSGLAELADGSLFFSFGKSATPTDAAAQPRIQQSESADVTVPTQNLTPGVLLQRHPSSFRKKSPIPAAARSRRTASKAEVDTAELGAAEIKETLVDSATSKTATPERPERPVSSFSKKSPIPKNRDGSGVSSSKRRSSGEVGSVVEAPSKPKFTKRSPISRNRNSNRATRSEKKSDPTEAAPQEVASKSEKKSDSTEATPQEVASKSEKKSDPTEAAPQEVASKSEKRSDSTELTPEEAVSRSEKKSDPTEVAPEEVASRSEKKSDPTEVAPEEVASRSEKKSNSSGAATAEVASSQPEPVVYESDSDLPVSPELREVLNDGKHTAGAEAEEDVKSSSVSVAKTKSSKQSKVVIEDNEVAQSEAVENGAASKDLSSYKLPELRSMAKAKGLKGYSKLKKGELVDLIAASEVS